MNAKTLILAAILAVGLARATLADMALVMVEQDGCIYCSRWHDEVGEIYPQTEFAERAPLQVVDIDDLPGDLTLEGRVVFTPTFLLVVDDEEIARVEGYAGDDLFWMRMELLTRDLDALEAEES